MSSDKKSKTRSASELDEELAVRIVEKLLTSKQFLDKISDVIYQTVTKQFEDKITVLQNKVDQLTSELSEMKKETSISKDQLEQYSRMNSLRIFGIPENKEESTDSIVVNLCNEKLGLNISTNDIDCSHRLPLKEGSHRPIIVKFCRRTIKDLIFRNKRKLKGTKIVIREDLTKRRAQLLKKATNIYGISSTWTLGGNIFVKIGTKIRRILMEEDLNEAT